MKKKVYNLQCEGTNLPYKRKERIVFVSAFSAQDDQEAIDHANQTLVDFRKKYILTIGSVVLFEKIKRHRRVVNIATK
jgi:hypothetical protein